VVVDSPAWLQRQDLGWPVVGPPDLATALADLFDLPLAGEEASGEVDEEGSAAGRSEPVPPEIMALLVDGPLSWCEHEKLQVDGFDVDWWVSADGVAHAATVDGLARALCWAAGSWELRQVVAEVLSDPAALPSVLVDLAFVPSRPLT
jgi:hypothetical protein